MPISSSPHATSPLLALYSRDFIYFVARRLYWDHCAQTAASLTYTTLLATVPLLVVGFTVLREFSQFPEMINSFQTLILRIFTPDAGGEVKQYIQGIVNNRARLPLLSFVVLIMTAVMMLYTIDNTLNRIWQVDYKRRTFLSLAFYLAVVISGPLLLGGSLALSTYLISRSFALGESVGFNWLASVPWLVTFVAFTAIYRWVPNTRVPWKYAASGGLLAMILFELAKWGFAQYIKWVPTYGLLYGALAAIPLTLVWIYLSWLVVLVGAETARCLEIYNSEYRLPAVTAMRLLSFLLREGDRGISLEQAMTWSYRGRRWLAAMFARLREAGLIEEGENKSYRLTDKAGSMTIRELGSEFTRYLRLQEK